MDVVEIDPAIARVATEQFQFEESERLKLVIGDGLEYISNFTGEACQSLKCISISLPHLKSS